VTDYSKNVYLGEFPIEDENNPYLDFSPAEWALVYIRDFGGIDGEHHKLWVMDQVVRILHGTPVEVVEARWGVSVNHPNGETNIRFNTGEPTQEYHDWVAKCRNGEDGPDSYEYDEGIAP
jgi:hypothetical protein